MEPQRANWLEKQLRHSKMRAMLTAVRSGTLSQMLWTDLPIGLSPGCSTVAELRNASNVNGNTVTPAPREVVLWFTQKLEPTFTSIEVRNEQGACGGSWRCWIA